MGVLLGLLVATRLLLRPRHGPRLRKSSAEYVEALRAMGMGRTLIVLRHILPNAIGPILIIASMYYPGLYHGRSWHFFPGGRCEAARRDQRSTRASVMSATPLAGDRGRAAADPRQLGFTFLGEALRDAFDPKLRRRG
ncbi:MAG: hypothetical protein R3D84_15805 [Paracoccaceae bacterium]